MAKKRASKPKQSEQKIAPVQVVQKEQAPVIMRLEEPKKQEKVTSKVIKNNGIKAIIIRENAFMGRVVLHPGRTIRLENKEAVPLLLKYKDLSEVK